MSKVSSRDWEQDSTIKKLPEQFREMRNSAVINHNYPVALDMHLCKENDEFFEICLYPLTNKFELCRTIPPFYATVKPRRNPRMMGWSASEFQERLGIKKVNYEKAWDTGIDRTSLADLLEHWKETKFGIREGKRISVVCHDWTKKKWYLEEWLGKLNFKDLFSFHVRDIQLIALFYNDWSSFNLEDIIFTNLTSHDIITKLGARDSYADTMVRAAGIAEAYKRMIDKMAGTRF
jgi:hypothetical protein